MAAFLDAPQTMLLENMYMKTDYHTWRADSIRFNNCQGSCVVDCPDVVLENSTNLHLIPVEDQLKAGAGDNVMVN